MKNQNYNILLNQTADFLEQIIRFPSTGGKEEELMQFMYKEFIPLADEVTLVPLSDDLLNDPEYSTPIPDISYNGRHNLRLKLKGTGQGKSLIFNAHSDVVPASSKDTDQFSPFRKDGCIYGRGACDDKGQIATMYLLLKIIKESGIKLKGDVIFHIVVEEENGGNGSLAAIKSGDRADAVIVLESSSFKIYSSVRGAVWFKVTCTGVAGHSGYSGKAISALKNAIKVMEIFENYHKNLLAASKGIPIFDNYENPMPITFGKLHSGDWPSATPGLAVLEGVLGFLPNKKRAEIMKELEEEIIKYGGEQLKDRFKLEFMYKHEGHILDTSHPLVENLSQSISKFDITPQCDAMVASCDAWLYSEILGIPTIVFGPGDLKQAHTVDENIEIEQIGKAAEILVDFLEKWCE